MDVPFISIILPVYNDERFIRRSLESALAQTYRNFEILVIDDGSTDKTADIVKSYNDPRIRYFFQSNQGQGPARNHAIKESRGRYITFLDADDYYLPIKVEKEVRYLAEHPEYKLVYCNAAHYDLARSDHFLGNWRVVPSEDFLRNLLYVSYPNINTLMISHEVLDNIGLFNETRYYPEDWELCLRMSLAGYRFGHVDDELVGVAVRRDSNTQMEIQHVLKKSVLDVLGRVFLQMRVEDQVRYGAKKILRMFRLKLAMAYLADGQKRNFTENLVNACPSLLKPLAYLIAGPVCLLPSPLLKKTMAQLWRLNQVRKWKKLE